MMTAEKWNDDHCFAGNGSAVIIINYRESHPTDPFEFYFEGIGLNSFSAPTNMKTYFWDRRDTKQAREFFERTFEIGSIWRISGQIEYDEDGIVFIDPVYMPYYGEACNQLKHAISNSELKGQG